MEYSYADAKKEIATLINGKKSFVIVGLGGELMEASKFVEKEIESRGLKCRVYTRNRAVTAASLVWAVEGLVALGAIAIHNLATRNPDYEIGRAVVDQRLYVDYKK